MRSCNATIPCLPGEAHSTDRAGSAPAKHWRYRGWCLLDTRGRERRKRRRRRRRRRKRRWWSHGQDDVSQPCTGRVGNNYNYHQQTSVVVPSQSKHSSCRDKYTSCLDWLILCKEDLESTFTSCWPPLTVNLVCVFVNLGHRLATYKQPGSKASRRMQSESVKYPRGGRITLKKGELALAIPGMQQPLHHIVNYPVKINAANNGNSRHQLFDITSPVSQQVSWYNSTALLGVLPDED